MFNKDVLVYVTSKCNLNCLYCYNEINLSKSVMHDRNIIDRVKFLLDKLIVEGHIERIMLTGGEPMLIEETYDLINYFRDRVKLSIYTNGTILSLKNVNKLSGVDVKISLHGAINSVNRLKRYMDMIPILESKNIKYGFIYMVTAENYKYLYNTYLTLRAISKRGGFSMKYQPLVILEKNQDLKNVRLRKRFSLANLLPSEWDIFEKEIKNIARYEATNPLLDNDPVYMFDENSMKYFSLLKNFYLYNIKPLKCDTAPMIVIGSDGNIRPCMFLFDRIISSAIGKESPYGDLIHDLSINELTKIKCAECFSEECIGALRPIK